MQTEQRMEGEGRAKKKSFFSVSLFFSLSLSSLSPSPSLRRSCSVHTHSHVQDVHPFLSCCSARSLCPGGAGDGMCCGRVYRRAPLLCLRGRQKGSRASEKGKDRGAKGGGRCSGCGSALCSIEGASSARSGFGWSRPRPTKRSPGKRCPQLRKQRQQRRVEAECRPGDHGSGRH